MKKLLLFLLVATGCSIADLSSKMDESNQLMKQNISAMTDTKKAIQDNTGEIHRSTETMQAFAAHVGNLHPFVVPALLILVLLILFMPVIVMMKLSNKFTDYFNRK